MRSMRFAVAFAGLAALALAVAGCGAPDGGGQAAVGFERPQDRAIGDPAAPVTVIEYASVTCSVCKAWHDQVWPQVKAEMVDTGKVRFVFREMPTGPVEVAMAGFLVARAAPEERYFGVLDTLFARQDQIVHGDPRAELLAVARSAGMSEDEFNACLRDEDEIVRINEWVEEARTMFGVNATPAFIINGETRSGYHDIDQFRAAVDAARPAAPPAS